MYYIFIFNLYQPVFGIKIIWCCPIFVAILVKKFLDKDVLKAILNGRFEDGVGSAASRPSAENFRFNFLILYLFFCTYLPNPCCGSLALVCTSGSLDPPPYLLGFFCHYVNFVSIFLVYLYLHIFLGLWPIAWFTSTFMAKEPRASDPGPCSQTVLVGLLSFFDVLVFPEFVLHIICSLDLCTSNLYAI